MRKSLFLKGFLVAATLANVNAFAAGTATAMAMPVPTPTVTAKPADTACYRWGHEFPDERTVITVKEYGRFGEHQRVFTVHGKDVGVCGHNTIAASVGTVITSNREHGHHGAHLGLTILSVRNHDKHHGGGHSSLGDDSTLDWKHKDCRDVTLDCTSEENDPTPDTWHCFVKNDFDDSFGIIKLRKIEHHHDDHRCKVFQNGHEDLNSLAGPGSETGPGQAMTK